DGQQQPGDTPIEGAAVWIDYNRNGQLDAGEPRDFTNAQGQYGILFIRPGVNQVRFLQPDGLRPSVPVVVDRLFVSGASRSENASFTNAVTITGHVFSDLNGDGSQSNTEPNLVNRLVYIDVNDNNVRDAGERSTPTDGLGNYRLTGLPPGSYTVRVDMPIGVTTSFPGS